MNIGTDIAKARSHAVRTYTAIARKRISNPGYTIHEPSLLKELLMFYMDGGLPPLDTPNIETKPVRKFVNMIYKKTRPQTIKGRLFAVIISSKTKHLFSIEDLANEAGLSVAYAYVMTLSLGFHVDKKTLLVKVPDMTSLSFFQAIYYDSAITYRIAIREKEIKLGEPAENVSLFDSAHEQIEHQNKQYALAMATSAAYDSDAMDPEYFRDGFFSEAPQWFQILSTGFKIKRHPLISADEPPPLPPRDAVIDIVDASVDACEIEINVVKSAYDTQIAVLRDELSVVKETNDKLITSTDQAEKELNDVRRKLEECNRNLTRAGIPEAPQQLASSAKELADVSRKLSDIKKTAITSNKAVDLISDDSTRIKDIVEVKQVGARNSLLDDIRKGKKLKPVTIVSKKTPPASDTGDLKSALVAAMEARREFINPSASKISSLSSSSSSKTFESDRFGRSKIRGQNAWNRSERKKTVVSPTSRAFGDVTTLL